MYDPFPRVICQGVNRRGVPFTVVEDRWGQRFRFFDYEILRQVHEHDLPGHAQKATGQRVSNGGYRRRVRALPSKVA